MKYSIGRCPAHRGGVFDRVSLSPLFIEPMELYRDLVLPSIFLRIFWYRYSKLLFDLTLYIRLPPVITGVNHIYYNANTSLLLSEACFNGIIKPFSHEIFSIFNLLKLVNGVSHMIIHKQYTHYTYTVCGITLWY